MDPTSTNRLDVSQGVRFAVGALRGRLAIPLSLIRQKLLPLADKVEIEVEAEPPGLRVRGSAQAVGAQIEFSVRIDAEGIDLEGERRLVHVSLTDVSLSTPEDAPGPLADAIRQRMIDTANPGTLVGNMVALPPFVVEAEGSTIVLDLMKVPALSADETMRTWVAAATSYLCVRGIEVRDDAIELALGVLPGGPREAARSTARALLLPAVRYLWPSGRNDA
ncbi:MAG: hypothetical protein AAGF92_19930 [Myxococcota bacterium]